MKSTSVILFLCTVSILSITAVSAQNTTLEKKWETDTTLKVPESVLYDAANKVLYVANIDGQPGEKDGKGSIGKVGLDGKVIAASWVAGLNAPKGMALFNNTLWVSDIDEMAAINISTGTVTSRIPIDSAIFLNDVTVDGKGVIYVSDSRAKKVHKIENGIATVYLENLQGPNGLLYHKNVLYVLDNGGMYTVGKDKSLEKIADGMEGGTDGIEHVKENDFIVSCWGGVIYYVKSDGSKETLLDTREQKINSADIGYDAKNKIVYVPTFWKNSVVAYQLK